MGYDDLYPPRRSAAAPDTAATPHPATALAVARRDTVSRELVQL